MNTTACRIQMLGALRVVTPDRVVARFATQKTAALLAFLAGHPHAAHPRETLCEMLWPEADPEAGRASLRVALNSLRRQLEPLDEHAGSILLTDRATVQLNPATVSIDVIEFEAALRRAAREGGAADRQKFLEQAVALYQGQLLPGYYEDWVGAERDRLSHMAVDALLQLAALHEDGGSVSLALATANRAVAEDSLNERAHAEVIRLHAVAGEPTAAQRHFQELERILAEQLGVKPSPKVQALIADIQSGGVPVALFTAPAAVAALRSNDAEQDQPSVEEPSTHLPAPLTRFFGREEEIRGLQEIACNAETRLVTVTGPGGCGKTRLAIETARRLGQCFQGGVWFVPLTDRCEARMVVEAMLDALKVRRSPVVDPVEQLTASFSEGRVLMVLDNFEQLMEEGAAVLADLLQRAASLTCLVTSRVTLDVDGEQEFRLHPLPVPGIEGEALPDLASLAALPSVRIFVDRAQGVRPDFQITPGNAGDVAAICDRLEGLPLAIELAASWAQTLTSAQIRHRLAARFDLLVSRRKGVPDRFRSLRAAIDGSFTLLPPELRPFFARLSVFRGGWSLAAAEAVCDEPLAMEYLARLRAASLVRSRERGAEMRFEMLETLRDYAAERLDDEERPRLARRHAAYYSEAFQKAEPGEEAVDAKQWLAALEENQDNLRAALVWSVEDGADPDATVRLVEAMWSLLEHRGSSEAGWRELSQALERADGASPALKPKAKDFMGRLAWKVGDYPTARAQLLESRALYEQAQDAGAAAYTLACAAYVSELEGDYTRAYQERSESLAMFRPIGKRWDMAYALNALGTVAFRHGGFQQAEELIRESIRLFEQEADESAVAFARNSLGILHWYRGELDTAWALQEATLLTFRALRSRPAIGFTCTNLGKIAAYRGDVEQARALFHEGLALARDLGGAREVADARHNLALLEIQCGSEERARRDLADALSLRRRLGDRRGIVYSLEGYALLEAPRRASLAASLFARAAAGRVEMGLPIPPVRRPDIEAAVASSRAALGMADFEAAEAYGASLSLDEAVALAQGTPHPF